MLANPSIARAALLAAAHPQWAAPSATGPVFPPLTLRRWLILESAHPRIAAWLTGTAAELSALDVFTIAYLLQVDPQALPDRSQLHEQALAWAALIAPIAPEDLVARIGTLISSAFAAAADLAPPASDSSDYQFLSVDHEGNGIGWVLTLVEVLAANYGWRVGEILDLPIATALALDAAHQLRQSCRWTGPSYVAQDRLDSLPTANCQLSPDHA